MNKRIISAIVVLAAIIGGLFYFRSQVYFSHGAFRQNKVFEISKGDGNATIGKNLKKEGLISGEWYFYYYVRTHGLLNKFLPGDYDLNGNMTIPEIAQYLTQEENILPGYIKITFPEGWDSRKMAERLTANSLDGDGFLKIVQDPRSLAAKYDFLKGVKNLEGYLFPDTYFFKKDIDASGIIAKMLDNFGQKFTADLRAAIKDQNKNISEIIIMASIVEKEVQTKEDRSLVSGIFWTRLKIGQALQSDATLSYILNDKKSQHASDELKINSPYNTYINKGLPPGPICNPGLDAIEAAVHPKDSDYNYFLSDPKTGNTIFAKSFQEHVVNRQQYGL